jgi:alkylation response protein AidB-like acyl-CoA dehydrogenase
MTEPHAGTDVPNYKTNTVIKGDRAVVNGVKTLISKAKEAEWFVVFSRINGTPGRDGRLRAVNRNTPGFEVTAIYHTMGVRTGRNPTNDLEVPVENVVLREVASRNCVGKTIHSAVSTRAFHAVGHGRGGLRGSDQVCSRSAKSAASLSPTSRASVEAGRDVVATSRAGRSLSIARRSPGQPFPGPARGRDRQDVRQQMAIRVVNDALQMHGG